MIHKHFSKEKNENKNEIKMQNSRLTISYCHNLRSPGQPKFPLQLQGILKKKDYSIKDTNSFISLNIYQLKFEKTLVLSLLFSTLDITAYWMPSRYAHGVVTRPCKDTIVAYPTPWSSRRTFCQCQCFSFLWACDTCAVLRRTSTKKMRWRSSAAQ